ncbi:MAG: outer membrane beta-barrel protein [Chitinispirillaceae bacterium]|nr:outer membrane beta-barrel protein [Chitinispirillaceae bacterium]
MKHSRLLLGICSISLFVGAATAGIFTPHLEIGAEGGATRSYLETSDQMTYLMEPTSTVAYPIRPAFTVSCNLFLGNYLGITSGFGYRHYGQSTAPTTVFLRDDLFEHDFESSVKLDYLTIPLVVKAGIRRNHFSAFLHGGIVPSLLVSNEVAWYIDDKRVIAGSSRMPEIFLNYWDVPLVVGGEAGVHFGKNGIVLIGEYTYGVHSIASGITGEVFLRGYGMTLQFRRAIF